MEEIFYDNRIALIDAVDTKRINAISKFKKKWL